MSVGLTVDLSRITAEVYHTNPEKNIRYVKVGIPSLNMYINSIQVKPSPKYPDSGLWVQWPAFKVGNRWVHPIEFSGESQLKSYIEDEIMRSIAASDARDDPINLDDIPF